MSGDTERHGVLVGALVSLAIHLLVAAVVVQWSVPAPATGRSTDQSSTGADHVMTRSGDIRPTPSSFEAAAGVVTNIEAVSLTARLETARPPRGESSAWLSHLWQSTLFAIGAGLLTLAFRRNRAHVRYAIWFSASVKFLVPFALATRIVALLPWTATARDFAEQALPASMLPISEPAFDSWTSGVLSPRPALDSPNVPDWIGVAMLAVWVSGVVAVGLMRLRMWQRIRAVVRASKPSAIPDAVIPGGVQIRVSQCLLEPGIVGWWRPILLLPVHIEQHLSGPQLEAVLAHEQCHIRRRDNLTASIHMMCEALFWFHPGVWWIGSRLVEERERACDEAVLRSGRNPRTYAEGIVKTCALYVQSPLSCVAGVTGSDLRKRIEAIMQQQIGETLTLQRKLLLGIATILAIVAPVGVGVLRTPRLEAQSPAVASSATGAPTQTSADTRSVFEVASVKPTNTAGLTLVELLPGGRFRATNFSLQGLITRAWRVQPNQIDGGPDWIRSDGFDIEARANPNTPGDQIWPMVKALLTERFNLSVRSEMRELPVYELTMARADGRLGPSLRPFTESNCARSVAGAPIAPINAARPPCGVLYSPIGHWVGRETTIDSVASSLTRLMNRVVLNRTGLVGKFDLDLQWTELSQLLQPNPAGPPPPADGPSLQVALQEQLGLKLNSTRGPVEVLVVERVERPTPD